MLTPDSVRNWSGPQTDSFGLQDQIRSLHEPVKGRKKHRFNTLH